MTKKKFALAITLSLAFSHLAIAGGDPVAGKEVAKSCVSCHGDAGISPSPEVPNLAGQIPEYIISRIKEFRQEDQNDSVMHGLAMLISDPKKIEDVAAYYGTLPRARYRNNNKALIEEGERIYTGTYKCHFCHGVDGKGTINAEGVVSPMVIGLSTTYFVKEMAEFRGGIRRSEKGYMMNMITGMMSDEDFEALAAYLSTR